MEWFRSKVSGTSEPSAPELIVDVSPAGRQVINQASSYNCDGCMKPIYDGQDRYHCWLCGNFDLCAECYPQQGNEHATHGPGMTKEPGLDHYLAFALNAFRYGARATCKDTSSVVFYMLYRQRIQARPCLGSFANGTVTWKTFEQVRADVFQIGRALRRRFPVGSFIGIAAPNCAEWVIVEYALFFFGFIVVPIHPTASTKFYEHILGETSCVAVAVGGHDAFGRLADVLPLIKPTPLLICVDPAVPDCAPKIPTVLYSELLAEKSLLDLTRNLESHDREAEALLTLVYTSGSTGTPKGVMLSNRAWNADITDNNFHYPYELVRCAFQPMAHSAERLNTSAALLSGGRVCPYGGGIENLLSVLPLVQPTSLNAPPRFWNFLRSEFMVTVEQMLEADRELDYDDAFESARQALVAKFGGKLTRVSTGGAPSSLKLRRWVASIFRIRMGEGYGSTEAGSIASSTHLDPGVDCKLEDVPELGYLKTDNPPRGEICVKTKTMFAGYYKDPERSKAAFTPDGYFRTGDIGERRGRELVVIDRKNNVFKLAQGEFVSPERIETILSACLFVTQLYIAGDSSRSCLVAIAVPNRPALEAWARQNGKKDLPYEQLCELPETRRTVLRALMELAQQLQLANYETPRAVFLEPVPWTSAAGLLTMSLKIQRKPLAAKYTAVVARLYNELEARSQPGVASVIKGVISAGSKDSDVVTIDSLTAVRLAAALKAELHLNVSATAIVQHSSIASLCSAVTTPTAPAIVRYDWAAEWKLAADIVPPVEVASGNTVLLTGATGFCGIFLLAELLTSTSRNVVCIVRALSNDVALQRLEEKLRECGLSSVLPRLNRVKVIAGDLTLPLYGLSKVIWDELARDVAAIIHCGATVNVLQSYSQLRAANVGGTEEALRLACTGKQKYFVHISTLSVFGNQSNSMGIPEDAELSVLGLERMSGYAQSKWVAEQKVWEASNRGLWVSVIRPDSVGGHSVSGCSNESDSIYRLLIGLCQMQRVPTDIGWIVNSVNVDFLSKVVIAVLERGEELSSSVYHVANTNSRGFSLSQFKRYARSYGLVMQGVTYEMWLSNLSRLPTENLLYSLQQTFSEDGPGQPEIVVCDNWQADAERLGFPPVAHPLTESLLHLYIRWAERKYKFARRRAPQVAEDSN